MKTLAGLAWIAVLIACSGDVERGAGGDSTVSRPTLASITPLITRELTPALARERLGTPDEETGSGLIIYRYRLQGGDTLSLGFPGYAPIKYAHISGAGGARTLPLR